MAWILAKERRTIYRRRLEQFWDEYKRKKIGILGILMLSFFIILAIFAPWLTPYDPVARKQVAQRFGMPQWVTIFPQCRNLKTSRSLSVSWIVEQDPSELVQSWGSFARVEYKVKTMDIIDVKLNYTFTHEWEVPPNEFYAAFTWDAHSMIESQAIMLKSRANELNITKIAALKIMGDKDLVCGTESGSTQEKELNDLVKAGDIPSDTLKSFVNFTEALEAMKTKIVDYVYAVTPLTSQWILEAKQKGEEPIVMIYAKPYLEYSVRLSISDPQGKDYLLWIRSNLRKQMGEEVSVRDFDPLVMIRLGYKPGKDNLANIVFSEKGEYTMHLRISFRPLSTIATASVDVEEAVFFMPGHVHGILGTDNLGADILSQLIYGARISLMIGLLAAIVGTGIGLLVGIIAGYLGGTVDEISMRIVDVLICLPLLPLLLALVSIYGKNIFYIVLFIGIFGWQGLSRVIRSQALSIRETAFIESAKACGASSFYIMIRHIVPNVLPVAFASLVLAVPGAILFEAALSFLGFGDPRVPTWGKMLQYSFSFEGFTRMAWWWILPPGFAIIALCLAFVFIGHAFDEVVNPRLRRRR
jgi:ABC-type dipeptide/oligopeptide/nickel transport system permease subunit